MTYDISNPRPTYTNMKCDECDEELMPVRDMGYTDSLNPDDGLVIDFHGGYGMYFDQMSSIPSMLLCKKHCELLYHHFPNMMMRVQGAAMSDGWG